MSKGPEFSIPCPLHEGECHPICGNYSVLKEVILRKASEARKSPQEIVGEIFPPYLSLRRLTVRIDDELPTEADLMRKCLGEKKIKGKTLFASDDKL